MSTFYRYKIFVLYNQIIKYLESMAGRIMLIFQNKRNHILVATPFYSSQSWITDEIKKKLYTEFRKS